MTRLFSVVVDCRDHIAQARWWAAALNSPVAGEEEDEAWLAPEASPEIVFVSDGAAEPKTSRNRVHLDIATYSVDEHAQLVEKLLAAGASRIDIGQGTVSHEVLADPEGNEFCVVEPRPLVNYSGPLASIVLDTDEPNRTAAFWETASGWSTVIRNPNGTVLRAPTGLGAYLVISDNTGPKVSKNRIHLDVAPAVGVDQLAEVERLIAAGARRIDIGQGDVSWVVLADPDGNEFCVLTPR